MGVTVEDMASFFVDVKLELLDELLVRHVRQDLASVVARIRAADRQLRNHLFLVVLEDWQWHDFAILFGLLRVSLGCSRRPMLKPGLQDALRRVRRAILR